MSDRQPLGLSQDNNLYGPLFSELRALREDVKLLLDHHKSSQLLENSAKQSDKAAFFTSPPADAEKNPTDVVLRELRGEMQSLKNTLIEDMNIIKDSLQSRRIRENLPVAEHNNSSQRQAADKNPGCQHDAQSVSKDMAEAKQRQKVPFVSFKELSNTRYLPPPPSSSTGQSRAPSSFPRSAVQFSCREWCVY